MLILNRRSGERFFVLCPDGKRIEVVVSEVTGGRMARIGIDAPPEYRIYREEMLPPEEKESK